MANIKIEVIRLFHPRDVFGKDITYPSGNIADICSAFKVGDVFVSEKGTKPVNFPCDWAWRDLYKDIAVLRFGGNFNHCPTGTIYTSCTDGMKPVIFKLSREESTFIPGSN